VPQKRKSKKAVILGRPKLPAGAAKEHVLRARVSLDEISRFKAAAKRTGKTLPVWVRNTLIDAS
jgi:hypothetical protein